MEIGSGQHFHLVRKPAPLFIFWKNHLAAFG